MQSFELALEHAPIVPLSDQLDHYRSVDFTNIDSNKFYYMTYDPFNEYIVEIDNKSESDLLGFAFATRSLHPMGPWIPLDEFAFHLTPEIIEMDRYKFYDYSAPLNSNVNMNGGRRGRIRTRRRHKQKKTRKLKRRQK